MEAAIAQFPIGAPMTEAEFTRECAVLQDTYGDADGKEAKPKCQQEWARFFCLSGWTKEQIAAKRGKSPRLVAYLLLFGRFLNFGTSGSNGDNSSFQRLSERQFRALWNRTVDDGDNERIRFQAVIRLMEEPKAPKPRSAKVLLEQVAEHGYADGSAHRIDTILAKFPEAEHDAVIAALDGQCRAMKWERSSTKQGKSMYRSVQYDRMISSLTVANELGPLIEELKEQGKRNTATISPGTVAYNAALIQELIDKWTK